LCPRSSLICSPTQVTKQIPTEVANAENEANSTRLQKASLEESRDAYRRTGQAVMSMVLAVTKTTTASPALFLLPILVVADAVQEITYIREIQRRSIALIIPSH
jgi:hypothetical protein